MGKQERNITLAKMSRSRAGMSKQSALASSWSFADGGVSAPSQISPATAQSESAAAGVVRVHEGISFGDDTAQTMSTDQAGGSRTEHEGQQGDDSIDFGNVKLIFTDLDGTLYPSKYEEEPKHLKLGLRANLEQTRNVESVGVPVVPATGNNLTLAQAKMIDPATGQPLRILADHPGIYCNGSLVKGAHGREIMRKSIPQAWMAQFVAHWTQSNPPMGADICLCGLTPDRIILAGAGGPGNLFTEEMMLTADDVDWMEIPQLVAQADNILSFLIMFPNPTDEDVLLQMQQWLNQHELLRFPNGGATKCNGLTEEVCSKHVHVPGLGPEIDITPVGVNKGSSIAKLMEDTKGHLGVEFVDGDGIAVFGDAGNDIELFGRQRSEDGQTLEPLKGVNFRPQIRVAMPWANDPLLKLDANIVTTFDTVVRAIYEAKTQQ